MAVMHRTDKYSGKGASVTIAPESMHCDNI